ncbi:DUF3343 domain-containing protein [Wukongibacter sp. M2B1]|uniref:DUF3343 domain-containing protein n=1 Tax=Wukongibacter sp. M2B1 TaxID=3088895 RepID=UPI003D7BA5D5
MNSTGNRAKYYLIVFNSRNHAYYLESLLKKLRYDCKLLQAPKYLSKSCNVCLAVYTEEAIKTSLEKIVSSKLDVYKVYEYYYDTTNNKKIYKVIKRG